MTHRFVRAAGTVLLLGTAATAGAQPGVESPVFRPWRPLVSIGGGLTGGDALGERTIETRSAAVGTVTPPPFTLFRTDSTLERGGRGEAVVAVPITRTLSIDLVGTAARRTMRTAITGDAESAPATSASQRVSEYLMGARASLLLPGRWLGRRARPFATVGGAYLRQLHEDNVLVETGQAWTAGAGVHWWLRGTGGRPVASLGLTAEAGWQWRSGGIAVDDGVRGLPTASLRVFAGF